MSEDLTTELMDILGEDGFFTLTESYAGVRLYVPGDPARSELPAIIGHDNAIRLSNVFPGSYVRVPLARTFRAMRYRDAGLTNREIARRLGLAENGVEKLFIRVKKRRPELARRTGDDRQTDLFK